MIIRAIFVKYVSCNEVPSTVLSLDDNSCNSHKPTGQEHLYYPHFPGKETEAQSHLTLVLS